MKNCGILCLIQLCYEIQFCCFGLQVYTEQLLVFCILPGLFPDSLFMYCFLCFFNNIFSIINIASHYYSKHNDFPHFINLNGSMNL